MSWHGDHDGDTRDMRDARDMQDIRDGGDGCEEGRVEGLSDEGAGIVRGRKVAFVDGALPGEIVRFRRRRRRRQYDEAELQQVLETSAARVTPQCAHFGLCGGCALQHMDNAAQLAAKQRQLQEAIERIGRTTPRAWFEPLVGPAWGYRRRARLGVRYVTRQRRVRVGFRERFSNHIAAIDGCKVLSPPVAASIAPLAALIEQLSLREQLPQIELAVAENATALVLRVLRAPNAQDEALLREFERRHGLHLYLQSGGPGSVRPLSPPAPRLEYSLAEFDLRLEFEPTDFIQINGAVNRALVARAVELLQLDANARVLDLYCGLGNFTLALARHARSVVGVEGDAALVERARTNACRNGLTNVAFHHGDLGQAPALQAPWLAPPYTHVLLDPPRLGAFPVLAAIAALAPQRLLYVSCHPGSLARDLGVLVHEHGFELLAAGVVDMFPHTTHVESLALLGRHRSSHGSGN